MSLLEEVVLDLERHSALEGWDTAPRLYALVRSVELRRAEPELADQLGLQSDADTLAALEQPALPEQSAVEDALATIAWPDAVEGCALVIERVVLPPEVEEEIPEDEKEAVAWAAEHPAREDVRMVVGVLRDGTRHSALRLRRHDADDEVLAGPDLVPALAEALAATLDPDEPDAAARPAAAGDQDRRAGG
ncbi:PPA1309 family protein [Spirillospora sp. NBC_01491]|uniref:PPA1309 family protein n=1 Tax=Spirillospora sp. NBC_01491 TaxID=2976007 RepID=UPI002E3447C8|nr:PPA1309 family protein [Spirillospora sp. NBC_01491]